MDVRLSIKSTSDSNPYAAKASIQRATAKAPPARKGTRSRRKAEGSEDEEDEEGARRLRKEREAARALAVHRRDEARGSRAYVSRTVGLTRQGGRRPSQSRKS